MGDTAARKIQRDPSVKGLGKARHESVGWAVPTLVVATGQRKGRRPYDCALAKCESTCKAGTASMVKGN
ncbi:hypothetical protein BaRGS_00022179 [Batillaria attramentaria]|uniref:Uncharacterized protein n=1 Tax=Batillaria attramentaria TaxID=370345 RepID=A0ABD0KHH1_9CAEN